jgi:hypothetical protein
MGSVTGNSSNTSRLFELKDVKFSANNQVTANLVLNLSNLTENFDLSLSFDKSINLVFTALDTALPQGWALQSDATEAGSLKLAGIGLDLVGNSPDSFKTFVNQEIQMWEQIVRSKNLRPD